MAKKSANHPRDFMTFAGWFLRPDDSAFETLPHRRQLEIRHLMAIRESGRIPTLADYFPPAPKAPVVPEYEAWFIMDVEDDVTLPVLRRLSVEYDMANERISGRNLTAEQADVIIAALTAHVTEHAALVACTSYGKGKTLKTGKPSDGVFAFVWRMARFHSGQDMTMPVMCYFDLEGGIETLTGLKVSMCLMNDEARRITKFLDTMADNVVLATGGNPYRAAMRWGSALGILPSAACSA